MMEDWENYTILETTVGENITNMIASDFNISSNYIYNATEKSRLGDIGRPGENATMKFALGLLLWTLPVIITVGAAGNSFSFIVLLQREMRQTSTFFYLAILAIADTMVLFMSAFKTWIRLCSGFEMLHISDASCKVFMFLTYCSQHLSAWLIVAVTIERFIVVWFPLKAPSMCSLKRAKLTSLGLVIGFSLLNSHLFWTAELVTEPTSGEKKCAMMLNNQLLYKEIIPWVHLTIYSFIPFVCLLLFNILIIISLIKHRLIIKNQMTRDDRRNRYNHRRLAITLLCISFIWIVTTTPSALYTVLPLRPTTPQQQASYFLVKVVCYILMYTNHSINFFLYCITGQTFRREFLKCICRTCRRKKQPKPRLMYRASRSGSQAHETAFPLMEKNSNNRTNGNTPQNEILSILIKARDENSSSKILGRLQLYL